MYLKMGTRQYYLNLTAYGDKMQAYKTLIKETVQLLATDNNTILDSELLNNDIDAMIDFETKLAKITKSPEDLRNATELYNLMTFSEVKKLFPLVRIKC